MFDSLGRNIDYLRLSLTDRCNMRCKYCMPCDVPEVGHTDVLRYEEFLQVCQAALAIGINRFKVTGGEPLVRKGVLNFLAALKALPGVCCTTITTNGYLLSKALPRLQAIGIDGINISLDAIEPKLFKNLTGIDGCQQVLSAIEASVASGIRTKVNTVLLAQNESQILPLASLAENLPVDVRFIELMPIGYGKNFSGPTEREVFNLLCAKYNDLEPSYEKRGNGPAVYYKSRYLCGRIGFIGANSHKFCSRCNRLRLTSTGLLKPCLCYEQSVDLRSVLRSGKPHLAVLLQEALKQGIALKPAEHCFDSVTSITEEKNMNQIGG